MGDPTRAVKTTFPSPSLARRGIGGLPCPSLAGRAPSQLASPSLLRRDIEGGRSVSHCATVAAVAACWAAFSVTAAAYAQNPNQFGAQDRADAAAQLIVIAVERAMASLPPTSGPSVTYEFDPASDAFRRSTRLGPTVLRSSQTLGPGAFSLQLATSYFEMSESFRPINYLITLDEPQARQVVAKLGLTANARVALMNISATYGLGTRAEISASLPLTVVDAHAAQVFSTRTDALSLPARNAPLTGVLVLGGDVQEAGRVLDAGLQPGGGLSLRRETFRDLGFHFDEGTDAGVGRISLGAKGVLLSRERLQAACMAELLLPSPSERSFAGVASAAVLPRFIATFKLTDLIKVHSDVGYEYDFDNAELRRFTWRLGGSLASERTAFDLGLGGAEFDAPVQWTPTLIRGGQTPTSPPSTGIALEDHTTGTSVVDVLLGIKLRLTGTVILAGGVSVPVVSPSFQPDVLGTIAGEWCF